MSVDDDDKPDEEEEETEDDAEPEQAEGDTEEEQTEAIDPRDQQIADLQAQLAEANTRLDVVSQGLFSARVAGLDLLGDSSMMPYSAELVGADDDALKAAVLALIASDPTLGKLSVKGDIDQGSSDPPATPGVSLLNILKEAI